MRVWLYGRWKRSGLFAGFRERLHLHFSVIYPMREEMAEKKAVNITFIQIAVFLAGGGFLMSFGGRNASYILFCLCILFLLQRYVTYAVFSRELCLLKEEMLAYLSRLTALFASERDLEDALGKAVDERQQRMGTHGTFLSDMMDKNSLSGEKEEYLSQYVGNLATTHLAQLYMVCELTDVYGDSNINGMSSFVTNINYIKENVRGELLLYHKRKNEFAMLSVISFIPFFLMRPMEMWARSVSASLLPYYEGKIELLGTAMVFVFTAVCFYLVQAFELPAEFMSEKSETGRNGFWKKADEKISDIIGKIIYVNYGKSLKKSRFIEEALGISLMDYYRKRLLWGAAGFGLGLFPAAEIFGRGVKTLPVGLFLAAAMSFIPYISAAVKHNGFTKRKKSEVLMLQTVILIMSSIKKITVDDILENMEAFSRCYKKEIEKTVDMYREKGTDCLKEMTQEVTDENMTHIFEGLAACDKVEPDMAFSDLKEERNYYMATLNEEALYTMKNEAALSKMLSFLPFCAVVLIKLVIPFVLDGLDKIGSF